MKKIKPTTVSYVVGLSLATIIDKAIPWSSWTTAILAIILWVVFLFGADLLFWGDPK